MFTIGPVAIRWYGLMMALSMAIGVFFIVKNGKKLGMDEEHLYNVSILSILGGIVGSRLIYVLTNLSFYMDKPGEIIRIDHGGLSWHGALLGGLAVGWWYAERFGLNLNLLADLAVPGLASGYMLVRIANIFNQEVLGRTSELFGRHPAQLYGSFIGLVLLVLHNYLARNKWNPEKAGYLFWSFFFYYSILRGFIEETFRANPLYAWGYVNLKWGAGFFTLTHLVTPALLLFSYYMMRRAADKTPR